MILVFLLNNVEDMDLLLAKFRFQNPGLEYLEFKTKSSAADIKIDEYHALYLSDLTFKKDSVSFVSQFATEALILAFYDTKINLFDPSADREGRPLLTITTLDSFRKATNTIFYHDLKLADSMRKQAVFVSNKNYITAYYRFLKKYEASYTEHSIDSALWNRLQVKDTVKLENNKVLWLFSVDSSLYRNEKLHYKSLESLIIKRMRYASILSDVLTYPIDVFTD